MHRTAPTIRRAKPKPPSQEAVQQQAVQQQILQLTSKWELKAVCKGSHDPAAQLQAARTLQHLVQYLGQHMSTCKHKATRALLQKQLPPELLLTLISSSQDEVVVATLSALQELACIASAAIPTEAAPHLVQLLCCQSRGAAAARVLTTQLSHWRFSQMWPHWLAAGTTSRVFQQLQQLAAQAQAADVSSSNTASRAADGCVSLLMLLSKLVALSEQQVLAQLAPDVDSAGRWLQLLAQISKQHSSLVGSHASAQLQDSCCAVLAGMGHAPATSLALLHSTQLRQNTLQLLHGVLRRPCCVSEADSNHIQCWMHAATAASLPVFWQQHHLQQQSQQVGSTLASHEEQQLLADVAIAAAATLCNECFSSSSIAKQVDGAAANLLAAALLPTEGVYGSHRSCTSRFMAAVLGSNCCHVLLHALAVSTNTSSEQAALLAAAAAAATASAQAAIQTSSRPTTPDQQPLQPAAAVDSAGSTASTVVLAPVQQELSTAWLLLRMISAQCAAVVACMDSSAVTAVGTRSSAAPFELPAAPASSSANGPRTHVGQQMALLHLANGSTAGSTVKPEQVLRVVQAYSSHITTGSDAHRVPGLLRSLHFLMCQSVLVLRHGPTSLLQQKQDNAAQQTKQEQEERKQRERLQWLSLTTDGASSSCSSNSESEGAELSAGRQQLLSTAAAVLDLILSSQQSALLAAASAPQRPGSGSASSANGASTVHSKASTHQLSWSFAASVYVSLAITVYLQERAPSTLAPAPGAAAASGECLSATDSCLALGALQVAAAALQLLLPVVVSQGQAAAAAAAMPAAAAASASAADPVQRQQQALILPIYEALECSLAAVQALAILSSLLQPALPGLLSHCVNNSCGYLGHKSAPEGNASNGSDGKKNGQVGGPVKLTAAKAVVAAAAASLDANLQQLLSQVVLSWQPAPVGAAHPSDVASRSTQAASPQLSVQAGLQQHLQQELRCLAAAALASCYGQLGAQTSQGAVLGPFRDHGAPFSDVQLQLGASQRFAGHAAVLAAGCPVLRQQLGNAAAAAAGPAGALATCSSSDPYPGTQHEHANDFSSSSAGSSGVHSGALTIKLSAAVDYRAMQQALDFIYTGAAVLPHAGLASQLQLCSSCLNPALLQGRKQLSEQKLAALQQQQVQELQEQQQVAKQQLHKLGMLARKLQLPLLASLTRGHRPQPGQCLPDLHLSFAALLPQQLLLLPGGTCTQQPQQRHQSLPDGMGSSRRSCTGISDEANEQQQEQQHGQFVSRSNADTQQGADQQELQQHGQQQMQDFRQQDSEEACQQQQQQQQDKQADVFGRQQLHHCSQLHPSSTEYLDMLAACAEAGHSIPPPHAICTPAAGGCSAGSQGHEQQADGALQQPLAAPFGGLIQGSFADAYLAAPVLFQEQDRGSHTCAPSPSLTQQPPPQHHRQQSACGSSGAGSYEQDWRGRLHYAFLPAHRVILSGCCPYFEALLSDRWHHEEYLPQLQASSMDEASGQGGSAGTVQQQAHAARVVLVPEADIHVAAALQHYMYTSTLQVQLPGKVSFAAGSGASVTAGAESGVGEAVAGASAGRIRLNGCCQGCHTTRTCLRLWRCAELLLLPQLQALCVAAAEAAAWQLGTGCCLVLLADCCQLGVPAVADALLAALTQRADRGTASAMPEWSELPAGLQAVLIKAWADKRLQQQEGAEDAPASTTVLNTPATAGIAANGALASASVGVLAAPGATMPVSGQLLLSAGGAVQEGVGGLCGIAGAGVQVYGDSGRQGLVLQQRAGETAVVQWQCLQELRDAGYILGDIVSTQLPSHRR